jgi:hypothetical protein
MLSSKTLALISIYISAQTNGWQDKDFIVSYWLIVIALLVVSLLTYSQ